MLVGNQSGANCGVAGCTSQSFSNCGISRVPLIGCCVKCTLPVCAEHMNVVGTLNGVPIVSCPTHVHYPRMLILGVIVLVVALVAIILAFAK